MDQHGEFVPLSDRYSDRVHDSFAAQALMTTLGARLEAVVPGRVEIVLAHAAALTQQHGFIHGGVVGAVLDTACGYAGFSLMDEESAVLTVEYKVNFVSPAAGQRFIATGQVIKPGRTLTLCDGQMHCVDDPSAPKLIAKATCTLIARRDAGLVG